MKRLVLFLIIAVMLLNFSAFSAIKYGKLEPVPAESAWKKSEVGTWMGNYNVWYKIDKKDKTVKFSFNKKKWCDSNNDVVWHDKSGKWIYIYGNKLMCSDNGSKWNEINNRTWQDMNGTWYRFDSNWDLWEVKG